MQCSETRRRADKSAGEKKKGEDHQSHQSTALQQRQQQRERGKEGRKKDKTTTADIERKEKNREDNKRTTTGTLVLMMTPLPPARSFFLLSIFSLFLSFSLFIVCVSNSAKNIYIGRVCVCVCVCVRSCVRAWGCVKAINTCSSCQRHDAEARKKHDTYTHARRTKYCCTTRGFLPFF